MREDTGYIKKIIESEYPNLNCSVKRGYVRTWEIDGMNKINIIVDGEEYLDNIICLLQKKIHDIIIIKHDKMTCIGEVSLVKNKKVNSNDCTKLDSLKFIEIINKKRKKPRMVLYPEIVNKIKCNSKNTEYRYSLDVEFVHNEVHKQEEKNVAMIIMQNPSCANGEYSDNTVNKVINYMYKFGYSSIIITNVIPFYATNIRDILKMNFKNQEVLKENDEIILKKMEMASKIFVAWGWINISKLKKTEKEKLSNYYIERINAIQTCLKDKDVFCYSITNTNQPYHPRAWEKGKNENDFKEFEFNHRRV